MSPSAGMSPIVKTISRWVRGLLLLYGLHMLVHGHLSPGGGFSGGVVIGTAFALVLIAEGRESPTCARALRAANELYGAAALAFLGLAAAGLWLGDAFFDNFIETPSARWFALDSSGTILLGNIVVGLVVAAGITLGVAALAAGRITAPPDEPGKPSEGART